MASFSPGPRVFSMTRTSAFSRMILLCSGATLTTSWARHIPAKGNIHRAVIAWGSFRTAILHFLRLSYHAQGWTVCGLSELFYARSLEFAEPPVGFPGSSLLANRFVNQLLGRPSFTFFPELLLLFPERALLPGSG